MKANGYGGAIIFDAGSSSYAVASKTDPGPPFLSEEWLELFRFAVSEADRLGLVLSINVQSGWNPGGPSVTPAHAMKKITWSDTTLAGPAKVTLELPTPPHKLLYNDLLVQAVRKLPVMEGDSAGIRDLRIKTLETRIGWSGIYPLNKLRSDFPGPGNGLRPEDVLDITPFMEEGVLTWDIPEGEWTLIRYGMTCTGVKVSTSSDGWDGLSMDHLNREALLQYDRDVISKLMETAKSAGNSLQFIHTDSWEMGVANWTDDYLEEFRSRRGYDPVPYLPVLTGRIVGARDLSNRFLRDFRLTVADLVAEDFYATFTQLAHDYGVYTHPESGGPHSAPIDAVRTMGNNDVPMGEFWVRSNTHRVADDQRLVAVLAGVGVGLRGRIEEERAPAAAPQRRVVAPQMAEGPERGVEVAVLLLAPQHRLAALLHALAVGVVDAALLGHADLGAVVDDGRAAEGELHQRRHLEPPLVPPGLPQEAVHVVVVQEAGAAEGVLRREVRLVPVQEGVEGG